MDITRRDFLNGVALAIVAGAAPVTLLRARAETAAGPVYYPPALTGLRGSHPGSFESAHALARAGKEFNAASLPVEETYDLVIVGAGISGLAAAWFYRQHAGADKRVLLLDNHDDFGGHAKRNEFTTPDGMILGYGGSESLQSPNTAWSKVALRLLDDLGVSVDRLGDAFDTNFYHGLGLSRGVFFDRENFGENRIVTGDPSSIVDDDLTKDKLNGRTYAEFISDFPMPEEDRKALITLHTGNVDYLEGMSIEEKTEYLASHSYLQFLRDKAGLSPLAAKYFQQRSNDFQAVGIDALSCEDARLCALPGFQGLGIPLSAEDQAELEEPYIHHFPDGNASLARLLVRKLIPEVAPGSGMDDVVLAKFDYSTLDRENAPVRLRLNAIGLHVDNTADGNAEVIYIHKNTTMRKVKAAKVIMAGYNMMIPSIVPSLPEKQREALLRNVKAPLVYTKVAIRNWQAFMKVGAHYFYCPAAPFCVVKLDYPVNMGGYKHSASPDHAIGLHMIHVPTMPGSGLSPREQARMGRGILLAKPFSEYEEMVRSQLHDMFGPAGFDHERDILAITVNRWPHGYAYAESSLWDDSALSESTIALARQPHGNIHIANSDAAWSPYAHSAIDEGWRAVEEIITGSTGGSDE
ncbi:FAD-dependent oxidoreductase [Phaeovibrio sulfidiphilus]|uniref:FAD-dependent oxidoreductase n=1 Tax=Phaeovibrio sulfidiphilus TaxID=1220600 RepID=A0A8J7CW67_9PROT|nr:NAD(P)/FAD-dependent oxidoreductase [Phaeovibrio sulfidiphilus]MBE1237126.1 FAD-dependent oxidoreductase [Phaeovibrio sulfidiphilus]